MVESDTALPVDRRPRLPCVLVLDLPRSMRVATCLLNSLMLEWELILERELARALGARDMQCEVAVVAFPPARVVMEFRSIADIWPLVLTTDGTGSLEAAISSALRILEDRRAFYGANHLLYFRPLLLFISDGQFSLDDGWHTSAAALDREQADERLFVFALGLPGADWDVLSKFSRYSPIAIADFVSLGDGESSRDWIRSVNWWRLAQHLTARYRDAAKVAAREGWRGNPAAEQQMAAREAEKHGLAAEQHIVAKMATLEADRGSATFTRMKKKRRTARRVPTPVELHRTGSILWSLPKRMRVGQTERVEVRLADAGVAESQLRAGLTGRGIPETDKLEVAPLMRVTLISDAKDFEISSFSTKDQHVRPSSVAYWDFYATPLRSGTRTLRILVSMRVTVGIKDEIVDLPSYERDVIVAVSPFYATAKFMSKNWQWVVGTVLIPLLVWAGTKTDAGSAILKQVIGSFSTK